VHLFGLFEACNNHLARWISNAKNQQRPLNFSTKLFMVHLQLEFTSFRPRQNFAGQATAANWG
jgi:hypothetical protein